VHALFRRETLDERPLDVMLVKPCAPGAGIVDEQRRELCGHDRKSRRAEQLV
jgi:hypothetical protein